METAISKELNSDYIIVFNDDTTKQISKERAEAIMRMSGTSAKFFLLDGQMFAFSNLARLITLGEYYEQFPDERPIIYPQIERPDEDIINYRHRIFSSEKFLSVALAKWKEQRSSPDYVRVTGGLDDLIRFGENKLVQLKAEKQKKLTINVGLSLSKTEAKKTTIAPRPRSRAEILAEIRNRRKDSVGELLIS